LPELRIDPLSGLRVIVAEDRSSRPGGGFAVSPEPAIDPATDPFLEGHEALTPPEIHAVRPGSSAADGPGWSVRVVPNKYPALAAHSGASVRDGGVAADPLAAGHGEPDLFAAAPAAGAHEVIVNAPEAVGSLHALGPERLGAAMEVWRERMAAHAAAACVHLSVNEGRSAGASLPHTHAQLYALGFVPAAIARERERFTAYSERTHGRNLLADLVQQEVRMGTRIVAVDAEAVAMCPFASRVPFQVQIVPRRPSGPRQTPIWWSERSSAHSGFASAVSSVKSA